MSPPIVPHRAVSALFLERQHLTRPRAHRLTAPRLARFVEDTGGLQLDSINVLDRAHYLTLWSRFGPYDRQALDRLVYRRRLLVEYWAHAACLVPVSMLPWWRRAMLDYRTRHTGWSTWLRRNRRVMDEVIETIRTRGPLANRDFERSPRSPARSGWWNWRPLQHALHYLWMTGALTVHSRQHFQKRFDLTERVLSEALPGAVTAEELRRWHVERSLHAMGAASETDLSRYLTFPRFPPGARRAALGALREDGSVTEIQVEGRPGRWLVLSRDLPALERASRRRLPSQGTTLLSPFDSLMWHRGRVERLFGFSYRIEVYTPGPDRVHGYYTLPILHHGKFIGRIDAKNHRGERRLEVRHVHLEPWFARGAPAPADGERLDRDEALTGLAEALGSLATFVGAEQITARRVTPTRLRAPLLRALRSESSAPSSRGGLPRSSSRRPAPSGARSV